MAIRIREVGGQLVALCAARSVEKPGDTYLHDGLHYALSRKFWEDYEDGGMPHDAEDRARREREESNNPNREEWDCWVATTGQEGETDG